GVEGSSGADRGLKPVLIRPVKDCLLDRARGRAVDEIEGVRPVPRDGDNGDGAVRHNTVHGGAGSDFLEAHGPDLMRSFRWTQQAGSSFAEQTAQSTLGWPCRASSMAPTIALAIS